MSRTEGIVWMSLGGLFVVVFAVGMFVITARDKAERDLCKRAGLKPWQAGTAFCVDPRNGALYAPQFVRKQ